MRIVKTILKERTKTEDLLFDFKSIGTDALGM